MFWHIFKKDVRLHWLFATGVAVLGWLALVVTYRYDHAYDHAVHNELLNLIIPLQFLCGGLLIAIVSQADVIPGVRQDWLVRPIERRDLLIAKLLFVLAMIAAPVFLGDFVEALADGFPVGQAFSAAALRIVCLLLVFYLPMLAFATLTKSFTENIVALVIAIAAYALLNTGVRMVLSKSWTILGWNGIDWIPEFASVLVAALGAALILTIQYFRRRVIIARWVTGTVGLLILAVNFVAWRPAFAIQQRLSARPGAASDVRLEFDPGMGRYSSQLQNGRPSFAYGNREDAVGIYVPLHISGLPPGAILRTDLMQPRLVAPEDRIDLQPAIPGETTNNKYYLVTIPGAVFNRLREQNVRLELDFSLTLLRVAESHAMPATGDWTNVPGFGRCESEIGKTGIAVNVRCLMLPATPPCAIFTLEYVPTGARNADVPICHGQYTPFNIPYFPDALRRARIELPLHGEPVDVSKLKDSRIAMKFYEASDHFTRQVVIPEMKLSDWWIEK